MPLKIQNYGDWEGDKRGGHHPPACTCYACKEEEEEERRVAEYDRRVVQTRTQGRGQRHPSRQPPHRPPPKSPPKSSHSSSHRSPPRPPPKSPHVSSGAGRGRPRRRRGLPLRLWTALSVVAVALVAVVLYANNPDFLAPLQDGVSMVAALAPTEEPPATSTPIPTPKPEPTVTSASPTLSPQAVSSQTMESTSASPAPETTPVLSSEEVPPGAALPSPTPAATAPTPPTPSPSIPVPTPALPPTIVPSPTPTPLPTMTPNPTPIPTPHLRYPVEKQYMLELINEERERAGVPPVELGTNDAAQLHAESALEHCFSSHWGVDGLKPYMRYSLAGGYQSNGENGGGLDYCYKASDGYRAIQDIEHRIRQMMDGWMGSPGHRRNILDRWHKRVNIGFAWDRYNLMGFQHFEGDYVEYDQVPSLEGAAFTLSGNSKNGALVAQGSSVGIAIYYDPPPQPLTRGQLSRTYCYTRGLPVAFVLEPLPGDWYHPSGETTTSHQPCPDPYKMSPEAAPPSSPAEAHRHWQQAHDTIFLPLEVTVPFIVASDWTVVGQRFSVTADISVVLDSHGPGIYTVILWGKLGGTDQIISEYSIFHEAE